MKLQDIPHNDASQIDLFAWQAINNWPKAAGFDSRHDGLDFGELIRWFLWSRVGRAIRSELAPKEFEFEKQLFFKHDLHHPATRWEGLARDLWKRHPKTLMPNLKSITPRFSNYCEPASHNGLSKTNKEKPSIFIPHPSARLEETVANLITMGYPVIVSNPTHLAGYAGSISCPGIKTSKTDKAFGRRLYEATVEGLENQGVQLLPFDKKSLFVEINLQVANIGRISAELSMVTPNALLLHGDNHSPYQEYVAVANRNNIPTITLQHGLDCERYYLDDVFCSAMAVWSEQRKQRYIEDAAKLPVHLQVTGNPAFDTIFSLPETINLQGEFVLWITRPHTSSFCYSPSRRVSEGIDILDILLDVLSKNAGMRLVIKPHPQDYDLLYKDHISNRDLSERAVVLTDNLTSLIKKATIVISEDSTGGLEAMLQGKILIHSHFASSAPVLPFHQYKAALPGYSGEMLAESFAKADHLSVAELEVMLEGQRRFIKDFAGDLDGMAKERQISFLTTILEMSNLP